MARRNAGTRANMSKFAQKWADKWVGDDLTRMESAGVTPTQDHKIILGWLRGNEMGMLASFFLDCVIGGYGHGVRDFYIDSRVGGKPVTTMYSGYVGKRDVNAALRRLQSARKNPAFGDYPRSNPTAVWRVSFSHVHGPVLENRLRSIVDRWGGRLRVSGGDHVATFAARDDAEAAVRQADGWGFGGQVREAFTRKAVR